MSHESEPECKLYDFTKSSKDMCPPQNNKLSENPPTQTFLRRWLGFPTSHQSYSEQFNSIKLSAGQAIYDKIICSPHLIGHYHSIMRFATNYERWSTVAAILDQLEGKEEWKKDPVSPDYDYELILTRLGQLRKARIEKDYVSMIYLMRTSLSRNFGDVGKMQLYSHTHIGTKTLIEAYNAEMAKILNMISDAEASVLDLPSKYEFFLNTRKAFGRTALLLSGGATLGLNHLGVCRALSKAKLLPHIISGASSGSIIAALVCTNNDDELERMLTEGNINMSAFEAGSRQGIVMSSLARLLKTGVLFDTQILVNCIKGLTGNYTFQEAYNKTRRTLNIPVSSSTVYEMPSLLNYMTAPNVLIWSAVAASCSVPLVFESNSIYAKDRNGTIVPWNPTGSRWIDGSVESDLPMNKLAEMFNVNHFIVCQVNPHVVPFLEKSVIPSQKSKMLDWTMSLARSELQHRLQQLGELGVMKSFVYRMQNILSQKYVGDITIVPDMSYSDFTRIFTNPSQKDVLEAISRGEKALWPKMSIIKNHCMLELCIDEIIYRLRLQMFTQTHGSNGLYSPEDPEPTMRSVSRSASISHFQGVQQLGLSSL